MVGDRVNSVKETEHTEISQRQQQRHPSLTQTPTRPLSTMSQCHKPHHRPSLHHFDYTRKRVKAVCLLPIHPHTLDVAGLCVCSANIRVALRHKAYRVIVHGCLTGGRLVVGACDGTQLAARKKVVWLLCKRWARSKLRVSTRNHCAHPFALLAVELE